MKMRMQSHKQVEACSKQLHLSTCYPMSMAQATYSRMKHKKAVALHAFDWQSVSSYWQRSIDSQGGKPVRRRRKTSGQLREAAIYGEVTALAGYKFRVMQLGRLVKEKAFDEATQVKEWSNWKMYADGAWIGKQEFQQIQREDSDFHLDQRI